MICHSPSQSPSNYDSRRLMDMDLDKLGVSVHYLKTQFIEEVRQAGLDETSNIYQIEDLDEPARPGVIRKKGLNTISPTDGKIGAAYVHCLEGDDNVGVANYMLSYVWEYTIGDIIDTLDSYCISTNLDPKRTYVWICCLCINQHRVVEDKKSMMRVPTDKFFREFRQRVVGIGHVLAMMTPWSKPKYLTRVWCVFELYTAHQYKCEITIVMPPEQKRALERDILAASSKRIDTMYNALGRTKIEEAEASVVEDRVNILKMVTHGVGYRALNNKVNELIRLWVLDSMRDMIEAKKKIKCENTDDNRGKVSYAAISYDIGYLLQKHDKYDESLEMLNNALDIQKTVLGEHHKDTAATVNAIGLAQLHKGDLNGSMKLFQQALRTRESLFGKNQRLVANTCNNIGLVLHKKGKYDGALAMHYRALGIYVCGWNERDIIVTYSNIGGVMKDQGRYDMALDMYNRGLSIQNKLCDENHPDTAILYNNLGLVLYEKGDFNQALQMHKKALHIQELVLGKDHFETAISRRNITRNDMKANDDPLSPRPCSGPATKIPWKKHYKKQNSIGANHDLFIPMLCPGPPPRSKGGIGEHHDDLFIDMTPVQAPAKIP